MKTFKMIDLLMQVLIVIGWLFYIIFRIRDEMGLLYVYFFLGGYQLLSFFVHLTFKKNWISLKERKQYGQTIFWTFIIGVLSYIFPPLSIYYLFALLIVSPVLAIWYFITGLNEWKRIGQIALTSLK